MPLITILRPGSETIELMEESALVKSEEVVDNAHEYTVATIYHLDGALVHRSVHVTLKLPVTGFGRVWNFIKSLFVPPTTKESHQ